MEQQHATTGSQIQPPSSQTQQVLIEAQAQQVLQPSQQMLNGTQPQQLIKYVQGPGQVFARYSNTGSLQQVPQVYMQQTLGPMVGTYGNQLSLATIKVLVFDHTKYFFYKNIFC